MKAIIPVAGHGTRLEPHTLKLQKCLLPVGGKPVLEHLLDRIIQVGITDVTLIIGHLGEQVEDFCSSFNNANFTFVEQKHRLGLGHAVYQGLDELDEPVLIVLGDAILELDYNKLIKSQHSTIGVAPVPDPERFGIVEIENNRITKFWEKPENPPSNLAISGIYYISSQNELMDGIKHLIENNIRTKNEYQLTDAFTVMLENNHLFNALEIDTCLDCGIPETMLSTNKILLKRIGSSSIHPTSDIKDSSLNFCTISENCQIEESQLENVIVLKGGKVINQKIKNTIVGFDEVFKIAQTEEIEL
ncbi:MAG: nucleotidyltransferase family protein [Candidatus Marinimicrobia bacterium]|nr:nucleotidyltransferase family protein [Candidatus Neomarinimicrobiota bacterium]